MDKLAEFAWSLIGLVGVIAIYLGIAAYVLLFTWGLTQKLQIWDVLEDWWDRLWGDTWPIHSEGGYGGRDYVRYAVELVVVVLVAALVVALTLVFPKGDG